MFLVQLSGETFICKSKASDAMKPCSPSAQVLSPAARCSGSQYLWCYRVSGLRQWEKVCGRPCHSLLPKGCSSHSKAIFLHFDRQLSTNLLFSPSFQFLHPNLLSWLSYLKRQLISLNRDITAYCHILLATMEQFYYWLLPINIHKIILKVNV